MSLRVLSLFSGIGAFEQALTNLNIDYDIVHYCEIDKYASKSYSVLHQVPESLNLGDITQVDIQQLPKDIDLLTHGSPCQSFSIGGKGEGGDKGSNTKSSLMWYSVEIIKQIKPKCIIWENVKNVLSTRHKHNFEQYCDALSELNYSNFYQVINSKDFNVPQNRERVYCISILNAETPYIFPKPIGCTLRLADILEEEVDEKYYLRSSKALEFLKNLSEADINISRDTENRLYSLGHMPGKHEQSNRVYHSYGISPTLMACERQNCTGGMTPPKILQHKSSLQYIGSLSNKDRVGDGKVLSRNSPSGDRVYSTNGIACTQSAVGGGTGGSTGIYLHNFCLRKLCPLETWLLMGFSREAFLKVQSLPTSDTQLYRQAGNSITVPVLESIYLNLPLVMKYKKVDLDN